MVRPVHCVKFVIFSSYARKKTMAWARLNFLWCISLLRPSKLWFEGFEQINPDTGYSRHAAVTKTVSFYFLMYAARYAQSFLSVLLEHRRRDFVEMQGDLSLLGGWEFPFSPQICDKLIQTASHHYFLFLFLSSSPRCHNFLGCFGLFEWVCPNWARSDALTWSSRCPTAGCKNVQVYGRRTMPWSLE